MSPQLRSCFLTLLFVLCSYKSAFISAEYNSEEQDSYEVTNETLNSTAPQDLYVIKTIVYEVGILTDAGNDTDLSDTNTREEVDLSIYDPSRNGSLIDLSSIPLPIQTNVSGVEVTGVLPSNLGSIILPANGSDLNLSNIPVLPNKQIKVTQNISTTNPDRGNEIISNLHKILGLQHPLIKTGNETYETETYETKES